MTGVFNYAFDLRGSLILYMNNSKNVQVERKLLVDGVRKWEGNRTDMFCVQPCHDG